MRREPLNQPEFQEAVLELLDDIFIVLRNLEGKVNQMAISQDQFDTDLAALVTAIGNLVTAVDALIASKPAADLTAEDQSVQTASQTVADELAKLNPAPPATTGP